MTSDSDVGTVLPDVHSLIAEYRTVVVPAVVDFLDGKVSANQFKDRWQPYYYETFAEYDRAVERSWRMSTGTDGRLESGTPEADPKHEVPLKHFPVSTAHNNLDRLIEVLAIELGDETVTKIAATERRVDLAHMVQELEGLMSSLAT